MVSPEPRKTKSNFDGLADEIKSIIGDQQFQTTLNKFVRKSNTRFKVVKAIGFSLALVSGLFGYLLKADSEADDRRAELILRTIEEKREWSQKVINGITEIRKVHQLIRDDCRYKKAMLPYEQRLNRFNALHNFVNSFSGIRDVFGDDIFQTCREITRLEEETKDICANDAPNDDVWRTLQSKVTDQMHDSIGAEREKLIKLSQSLSSTIFKKM